MIPIDLAPFPFDNTNMSTEIISTVEEDLQIVNEAFLAGRPIPVDVAARIDQRAAEMRARILRDKGPLDLTDLLNQQLDETGH